VKTRALHIALGSLICLALLAAFSTSGAQVPTDPTPPQYGAKTPELQRAPLRPGALEPPPSGTGFIPPPMDLSHLTGQRMPGDATPQSLPSSFDWRDKDGSNYVTSVKDQSTCGSCYTFASIANIESKLLIDAAGTFDFSENNAKECNWRELNDFQYPDPGDYWGSCDGGNYHMMASLFSQKGTVLDSCDPYVASDVGCNSSCTCQKTLLDWRIISGNAVADTIVLKQYIYDNGPVYTSVYADSSQGFNSSYNGSFTFNYTTPGGDTNHAVMIVGWSNDLPPVPGGGTARADGWIVKNSWGSTWGANGYFYITYGSANIGTSSSFIHEWQDYDADGDIWYYDDDGWWSSYGESGGSNMTAWGLAKFSASSNTNVTRVEFWTADATTDVGVYIYDGFDGTTLGNLLASKLNSSFDEAGYHSVELDSPLAVSSGEDVVAVVKFTDENYGYPVVVDQNGPIETGRTYISISGSSGSWTDLGTALNSDAAIRVRTSTSVAPAPTVTGITPSSGVNTGTVHITNLAGTNFQSGATVKLTKSGQSDINATNVTVVSPSQITCDFDLTGAATGQWNVVVRNPDSQTGQLDNGFTVNASPTAPTVTGITPASGVNTGTVHITNLAGTNFQSGATVKLTKSGQSDIAGTSVTVVNSNTITCDFDLTGAATGQWNVVVTNLDAQSGMLSNGFTVSAPGGGETFIYLPLVMRNWPPVPDTPVLNAISNPDGDGNYTVSWNVANRADTYTLHEDDNASFSSPTTRYTGSGTSWNASDKPAGTHYYRVRATNSWGDSGWSNTQSVSVQTGWATILSENFEGSFPGSTWTVRDNNPDSGRYYWGNRNCKPHGGSYSAWNVGAGDTTVSCGSDYRIDMFAWMIYGPFSLANATAAELTFDWWSDTELDYDAFLWSASTNGDDYYGTMVTGNWASWTTGERLDLSAVPTLGNLLGRNQVWIAFAFGSDNSVTDKGSFVDNVVLRKRTGGSASANQGLPSLQWVLQPDQTMEFGKWRLDQPGIWLSQGPR